ncbi:MULTISPECIES: hypothetical protein [unclassified Agarivorans]|uniref:hypothetical protein n=1 Tax=unclassified Agarivorans TaxID=2636026 RepID=UPI003D7EA1DC
MDKGSCLCGSIQRRLTGDISNVIHCQRRLTADLPRYQEDEFSRQKCDSLGLSHGAQLIK